VVIYSDSCGSALPVSAVLVGEGRAVPEEGLDMRPKMTHKTSTSGYGNAGSSPIY